jgi:hypothetical protein
MEHLLLGSGGFFLGPGGFFLGSDSFLFGSRRLSVSNIHRG